MEQQPGRRQGGRPPAGDGRPAGNRPSRPAEDRAEDYVQDDPTMVRPFVKAGSGNRRPRQGADGGASGGRSRQGTSGASGASGGQGRQQGGGRPPEGAGRPGQPQNGRSAQNGRAPQNGQRTQGGRNRQNNPNVPGPRPAREADPQQVPGLVSTPMPPPRAVARPQRPDLAPYPELDPPMSDLTTTMPILAIPAEDQYDGPDGHDHDGYAPPGEHGHFHDDADFGRHRGGNRPPRALKAAGLVIGVVVAGVAAYSVFGGGSGTPSAGPAATGTSSAGGGVGTPSDSATSAVAGVPAPTGTPTDSTSTSASRTTTSASHSSKSASKSSSSSHPSTSSATSSRPSTPPSTTASTSTPPAPPPSVPSPTFTTLGPGSNGPAVTQLQQNLRKWGGYYGWPSLRVNGNYDQATQNAVEAFQDANNGTSPPDAYGTYGPATDKALQQAVG